jgi:hypothetical protein
MIALTAGENRMPREMIAVDVATIKAVEESIGRSGRLIAKTFPLETGVAGLNMDFTWTWLSEGYGTPRHRHTFDQVRYVLDGEFSAGTGDIKAGQCAYFPEGVPYGPQHQDAPSIVLILQFPGPSGEPYLTHTQLDDARKYLIAQGGSFKDGVYTRITPDGRKFNKDSHAACVEHLIGREPIFPEARFRQPVIMLPEACRWVADRKHPGMERKHLGTFAELRTGIGFMRLLPGTRLPAAHNEDAEIRYLVEGSVSFGGKTWHGGKTAEQGTYFFLPADGEIGEIRSDAGATFFSISLPMIAEMGAAMRRAAE